MYASVFLVRSQAWSQPRWASSSRMRINSGTAIVGCVSLSWMAAFSGSLSQSCIQRRNRRTISASEQATRKYSCTKRNPCPAGRVVRIQHAGQGLRFERLPHRAHEIAGAKFLKVEVVRRSRGPQPEGVDRFSPVAHDRAIKRNAEQA